MWIELKNYFKKTPLLWVHLSAARHIGSYRLLNAPRFKRKKRDQPLSFLNIETFFQTFQIF